MSSSVVQQFVSGLKSRHRETQNKAAQDLYLYVKTELRDMSQEELVQFFDDFNHHIFDMVKSSDVHEKKGGVLAISKYQFASNLLFFSSKGKQRSRSSIRTSFFSLMQHTALRFRPGPLNLHRY